MKTAKKDRTRHSRKVEKPETAVEKRIAQQVVEYYKSGKKPVRSPEK